MPVDDKEYGLLRDAPRWNGSSNPSSCHQLAGVERHTPRSTAPDEQKAPSAHGLSRGDMIWTDFGGGSIFISRHAHKALSDWGRLAGLSSTLDQGQGRNALSQEGLALTALQVQAIIMDTASTPLLDRVFLVSHYAFGRNPGEIAVTAGVPFGNMPAVMEQVISRFARKLPARIT